MDVQQSARVKDSFRQVFHRQLAVTAIILPAMLVLLLSSRAKMEEVAGFALSDLLPIAVVATVLGIGLTLWNWRCPACNGYLGKAMYPRHCAQCGAQLHD